MLQEDLVREVFAPPGQWTDTPEQARLRACITEIIAGGDAVETITICYALIELMRNQLMSNAATVRRLAAREACYGESGPRLKPLELAAATGQSIQTVLRLLTESPRTVGTSKS